MNTVDQVLVRGNIGTNGEYMTETYFAEIENAVRAAKRNWKNADMKNKPMQLNCDWIEYDDKKYYACEFDTETCWDMHTTCVSGVDATQIFDDPSIDFEVWDEPLNVDDIEIVTKEQALADTIFLSQFIYDNDDLR